MVTSETSFHLIAQSYNIEQLTSHFKMMSELNVANGETQHKHLELARERESKQHTISKRSNTSLRSFPRRVEKQLIHRCESA